MEQDQLAHLRENQISFGLKLLHHCQILATRMFGWTPTHPLPQSKDPEDIVFEILAKYLDEDRHFNPAWPVMTQLKKAVQRRLEWLRKEAGSQLDSLDELLEADENAGGADSSASPDWLAADRIDTEVLWELVNAHPDMKRNEDIQLLLLAVEEGANDPTLQSEATGFTIEQIYELRDKLRAVYRAVLPEYHKGGILQ